MANSTLLAINGSIVTITLFILVNVGSFFYFKATTDSDIRHIKETKADKTVTVALTEKVSSMKDILEDIQRKVNLMVTREDLITDKGYKDNEIGI